MVAVAVQRQQREQVEDADEQVQRREDQQERLESRPSADLGGVATDPARADDRDRSVGVARLPVIASTRPGIFAGKPLIAVNVPSTICHVKSSVAGIAAIGP